MRRTLPRLLALALLFAVVSVTPVAAQDQVAAAATAVVLPAALTSSLVAPAPLTPRAAETATPRPVLTAPGYPGTKRPTLLPALYVSTAVLQVLDATSTTSALSRGATEANPLMKGVVGHRGALLAVKAGVAGATIFCAERMWKRNPVGAVVLMAVINGVNAAVVAHNYQVARSLR